MKIDSHQHFWKLDRGDYAWLGPQLKVLYKDFLPDDLSPLLEAAGVDGTILVQAAPTLEETEFLLSLAEQHPFIKGVVGWVDFASKMAPRDIEQLAVHPAMVGLRPMIQDTPDPNWMLRPELTPAFEALIASNLTFDALTGPMHLGNLRQLLEQHPDMRVVIDHGSKPGIRFGDFDDWARDMAALAEKTSAFCKFSGLVTEAAENWTLEDLQPYVDHLLRTFGPSRLMWGSDWPVCLLGSSYEHWLSTSGILLRDICEADRAAIFGLNATRAYNLGT
ncbi:amidohydrolase family protein [Marinobacterium rhizophilum]|uniref:Amidohydrolase family protein n=1 Tax=Marinobacterium rhizophilum TaxID=420402 RepID=A0ABY5HIB2_9GAMM|nr:amidohydrolase family protein [Marinobacterium rhizophilum]UTW12105.1 amidohydrolase family protein [Marinobacterium rhizophilum]